MCVSVCAKLCEMDGACVFKVNAMDGQMGV